MLVKWQVGDVLDLVDEHNNPFLNILQNHVDIEFDQALPVTEDRVVLPPGLEINFEPQLP